MKLRIFLMLLSSCLSAAAAAQKPYEQAKIVSVEQQVHTRVLYYIGNTPITKDDPYFIITVQLDGTVYKGEYEPRHSADNPPDEWNADFPVQVRLEKRHMFIKRPDGGELDMVVAKRTPAAKG